MKLFVTYGWGTNQRNNFSVSEAPTELEAYQQVFDKCENKYAFTYSETEFAGQQERYGLTEIPLQPQVYIGSAVP